MQTIVIFGACSAIAQATARLWAKKKMHLILIDRDEAKLNIVADDLKVRGAGRVQTFTADLANTGIHAELWSQIKNSLQATPPAGGLQLPAIVLMAYGTLGNQKAGEKDFAVAEKELQTNFISVVSLLTLIANDFESASALQATSYKLKAASIAVISSVAGDRGRQSNYIYGTAKGALTIFLSGLRNRLAKKGVNVITIKPGFVDTPMTAEFKKGLLWVKPEAIAKGIVNAINKKKSTVYLPWFWRYIMLVINSIPETLFKKMSL